MYCTNKKVLIDNFRHHATVKWYNKEYYLIIKPIILGLPINL
jgi:hypothetical protein